MTETEPPETEPLETVSFEDLVEVPDTLYEEPVHERVCIAVQPTGKVASGEERLYIIPENQDSILFKAYRWVTVCSPFQYRVADLIFPMSFGRTGSPIPAALTVASQNR